MPDIPAPTMRTSTCSVAGDVGEAVAEEGVMASIGSAALRAHAVGGVKIRPRMGDQLIVGRMIHGLDADDPLSPLRVVGFEMLDQLGLCQSGAGHQHLAGIGDALADAMVV